MNKCEAIAASMFLSHWPENMDYKTLMQRLKADDFGDDEGDIDIWYPFEVFPGDAVAIFIDELHQTLLKNFGI